jgi:hypothetical protein
MKSIPSGKTYSSPVRKLARFFEKSRDQWKAKCRSAKVKVRRLTNRVRFLEGSRARWKKRTQELETELAAEKAARQKLEQEAAKLRNTQAAIVLPSPTPVAFRQRVLRQQYWLGCIFLFISFVLSAATSLRGASRVMAILLPLLPEAWTIPSRSAGRMWLLRVGYFKLTRPKAHADDWVWILDHTVQIGATKCLLILGVRLSAWSPTSTGLRHTEVEPLALIPVTHSNGTVVTEQLEATVKITGVPREIIGDHGSDVQCGVETFRQAHGETCSVYDIKHKTAAVLKRELEHDAPWLAFVQQVVQTRSRLQQTALAPLLPPNLRTQARYMNVECLIAWGGRLLSYVEQPPGDPCPPFDAVAVEEKLGWLREFREPLAEWRALLEVITTTERVVRDTGLTTGLPRELETQLPVRGERERVARVRAELLAFVTQEAAQARPHERLLGSSEVVESVFGKLKYIERNQAKSGFTGLLLSVCAMVSTTTHEVVQQALETVSVKQVMAWCKKNLGASVQAQRRAVFTLLDKAEQKQDQLPVPA